MKTRLLLVLVLLLPAGCTSYGPPKPKGWFHRLVTLDFRSNPAEKFEKAVAGDDKAREALFEVGHEGAVLTQAAIVKIPGDTPEKSRAQGFADDTVSALDTARGTITPGRKAELLLMLDRLGSSDERVSFLGGKELNKWHEGFFEIAEVKRQWEADRSAYATASAQWGKERDATARKFERLKFWFWAIVIGYVLIMWVLPILAKAFPALRAASTVIQGVVAPGIAVAYSKTRGVLGDLVQGVQEIRKNTLENMPAAQDAVNEELEKWVVPEDGSQQMVDAIKVERKLT